LADSKTMLADIDNVSGHRMINCY